MASQLRVKKGHIYTKNVLYNVLVYTVMRYQNDSKGVTIQSSGGVAWVFFEIYNFGQTLHEINNLFQKLIYANNHVIKFEFFSTPPSRVEINNLSATEKCPPPPGDWMVAP